VDNPTPTLPDPDVYERLLTLVDASAADRGWHAPHLLIKVEEVDEPAAFDLGMKELPEGSHPVEELWGFRAPPTWLAIGVVSYGWAAPMDGIRPSLHPERSRVRATILVTREGRQLSTATFDDGRAIDEPGDGMIADVLRLCVGAPTAPPPPIEHLADILWLRALVVESSTRRLTIAEAERLYREPEGRMSTWRGVRLLAASTVQWPFADDWMDDGFFARELLATLPTVDELLAQLDSQLPSATARKVRARVGRRLSA